MIECLHWSACGVIGGGCCAISRFSSRPSIGTCKRCLSLSPDELLDFDNRRDSPASIIKASPPSDWGPKLWAAMHMRQRLWTDATSERAWLTRFAGRIAGGCSCRSDWVKIITADPPDLSSPDAYFAWGVRAHNAVNRKLGKAEVSLDMAAARWKPASR